MNEYAYAVSEECLYYSRLKLIAALGLSCDVMLPPAGQHLKMQL